LSRRLANSIRRERLVIADSAGMRLEYSWARIADVNRESERDDSDRSKPEKERPARIEDTASDLSSGVHAGDSKESRLMPGAHLDRHIANISFHSGDIPLKYSFSVTFGTVIQETTE
jgi:hypothetical protein